MQKFEGLSENEIKELQNKYGLNVLLDEKKASWFESFINQFKSPLIYILVFVAIISLFLKEFTDAALLVFVLLVNVVMGFYQEHKAQRTIESLKMLIKPTTVVIRDGKRSEIEAKYLVPGDVVVLGAGDRIPADGQLLQSTNVLANEAILTGEEEAVPKIFEEQVYMGTIVISGKGLLKVTKIGKNTEIGKINQSLLEIEDTKTPLQKNLEDFIKNFVWIILGVCLVIFVIGTIHHEGLWDMFRMSVILGVAAIPEALPIAITVILTLGMRRILKRHGLVKKLLSIETLGSTTVICTDKTGTLTEGTMQVVKTEFTDEHQALMALTLDNEQKTNLETALWEYVKNSGKLNPQATLDLYEKVDEEPFDSEKKYSLSINIVDGQKRAFLLGAPEIIQSFCNLSDEEIKNLNLKIENWANDGLRLLGVAYKKSGDLLEKKDFSFLGLVGIQDPIRAGVKEAIYEAQKAGIKIKIVTGDYRRTAEIVAQNLGLATGPQNIMEGSELETISDENLKARIENITVFSRVTPHQKLKIVKALQEQGEIVAMTGDGVNDSPALKKSDIGVTVGDATDVAKEAGDLILLDNNFKTIVAACEEGRVIFSNIKKVVGYVLSNAFAIIVLILGAILLDFPAPLTVVQILWIHIICDGPPDIVLGFEPKENNIMELRPQEMRKEKILSLDVKLTVFLVSIFIGVTTFFFFRYFLSHGGLELAQTFTFAAIASVSLIYILAFKNLKKSLFKSENFFGNPYLLGAIIYGFALIYIALYVPFFNKILHTIPLNFFQWLCVLSIGIGATVVVELVKYFTNRKNPVTT